MADERLQKIIARTGLCSRREADGLIAKGRVTVNGQVARPGATADPAHDHIKVDGKHLRSPEPLRYILLYKPAGVVTTTSDPEGRTTVVDLVRGQFPERVFPVGRLDYHSEGLLILTNDGELAERIAHPRHGLVREYMAKVRGDLGERELAKLLRGASIEGHRVRPKKVLRERGTGGGNTWWRVQVTEGRTHEVRELFFRVGHPVQRLRRVAIGPVRDDLLQPGVFRELTSSEIDALRQVTAGGTRRAASVKPATPGRSKSRTDEATLEAPRRPRRRTTSSSSSRTPGGPKAPAKRQRDGKRGSKKKS